MTHSISNTSTALSLLLLLFLLIGCIRQHHPVPIAISSSQSPLLSVTPVRCMDTANFLNVEVRFCYSFSKHNFFSAKAKESFVKLMSESLKRSILKTGHTFFNSTFKNSHFCFVHKDNAKWCGRSSGSLILLLFTRFAWDCTEISVYGSSEIYRSQPDVLGRFACGPAQTFSPMLRPAKG